MIEGAFEALAHWVLGGAAVVIGCLVSMVGAAGLGGPFLDGWVAYLLWLGGATVLVFGVVVIPPL